MFAKQAPKAPTGCPEWVKTYFFTGDAPAKDSPDRAAYITARFLPLEGAPTLEELWHTHRAALLREWVKTQPGSRPPWWWMHEASELRRFLPGQGVRSSESAHFYLEGVPLAFPDTDDPDDLVFEGKVKVESQATYLRRLRLFLPGERVKRTAYRPEVFDFTIPAEAA